MSFRSVGIRDPTRTEPITIGHEGCGHFAAVHPDAEGKGFVPADTVGFLFTNGACFECEGCQVHNTLCQRGNPFVVGFAFPGFFAEYALVDWQNAIHLPDQWDPKSSSALFCAGLTVIEAGGLGQLATQFAKALSAKVIAIGVNDLTLQVCKERGADFVFNSRTDAAYAQRIKELTNGGVHAAAVYSAAILAYILAVSGPESYRPSDSRRCHT
ncbi:uncharacterized protein A1O5_12460 [Cladophialophora psammophila CBS 110553]|uniref:Alcohol dehydrogenase-like C-terminal domain-containing protein n=1 Tax=Cladophialophora psammophila CBS 110553 TaxID=1182543 RepID=W9VY68_9EURO|nr:uncharacterized protein A1O5_12460 [Cladophialophora psammophila CBS 110553]EXJ57670.1 hypothetical protein A1O5_12460 [Cladophialophora psammophila CBS 110553]